jgi:hypothetical protein
MLCLTAVSVADIMQLGERNLARHTLKEEHGLRVSESRVLRKIFWLKRDEETGEWSRLHNEDLLALYCSPNVIRVSKSERMRWGRGMCYVWCREDVYAGF